jgi:hypothetical protein
MPHRTMALLITLTLAILAAPFAAEAQRPTAISRIGYLWGSSAADAVRHGEVLRQGVRDLGYLEGQPRTRETLQVL